MVIRGTQALAIIILFNIILSHGTRAQAQNASMLYGKTYNFVDRGKQCLLGSCLDFAEPGRIQVLRGGTILYFFGNHRGGFNPQGIRLELNRTVSLGGGRVPRGFTLGQLTDVRRGANAPQIQALGGLPFRGGTGTTAFDGRRVRASLVFNFAGPLAGGGNGSSQVRLNYVFNTDGASGAFLGGSGQLQGSGTVNGLSSTISGTSTLSPR